MAEENSKKGIGKRFAAIPKFFGETRSEMKKVSWPTRKQLINNTIVVLTMVIIVAILIFILDKTFETGFNALTQWVHSQPANPNPGTAVPTALPGTPLPSVK